MANGDYYDRSLGRNRSKWLSDQATGRGVGRAFLKGH